MPWTTRNYPVSWKNFEPLLRKKAIDIANAMIKDGYTEEQAIPIATAQAKKWFEDADPAELKTLKYKDVTKHKAKPGPSGARLMDDNVLVTYNKAEKHWVVKSETALSADSTHRTKAEAVKRAKEIVAKRGTKVIAKKCCDS